MFRHYFGTPELLLPFTTAVLYVHIDKTWWYIVYVIQKILQKTLLKQLEWKVYNIFTRFQSRKNSYILRVRLQTFMKQNIYIYTFKFWNGAIVSTLYIRETETLSSLIMCVCIWNKKPIFFEKIRRFTNQTHKFSELVGKLPYLKGLLVFIPKKFLKVNLGLSKL